MFKIVPDEIHKEIHQRLDAAYLQVPEAAQDRRQHYMDLLDYFDKHGILPEFSLVKAKEE